MNHHFLHIKELELEVFLGWPETERKKKQMVSVDIYIFFKHEPKACVSDNLKDAICYADLIAEIRDDIQDQSFRLLEHFTFYLQNFITNKLTDNHVTIHVTKFPAIPGLKGGVQFCRGESG